MSENEKFGQITSDEEKEPLETNDNVIVPHVEVKMETSEKEFQAGLKVLNEMDESIFDKKLKVELFPLKLKNELKEEPHENEGNAIADADEHLEIISDDNIFVVPQTEMKLEHSDTEFQAGMKVLNEMNESIFDKKPKIEAFNLKPKNEVKEEQHDSPIDFVDEVMIESGGNSVTNASQVLQQHHEQESTPELVILEQEIAESNRNPATPATPGTPASRLHGHVLKQEAMTPMQVRQTPGSVHMIDVRPNLGKKL